MKARKGLSLVGMSTIAIIIIVLSTVMLLSNSSSIASSEASGIITNLRIMKTAAATYYTDNVKSLTDHNKLAPTLELVAQYADEPEKYTAAQGYCLVIDDPDNPAGCAWWVGYNVTKPKVAAKLTGKAQEAGLYSNTSKYVSDAAFYSGTASVYINVR